MYQAGTLSGNPIAMAAGLACLTELSKAGNEEKLAAQTKTLAEGFKALADKHGVPLTVQYVGGMFGLFFTEQAEINNFQEVMKCDAAKFNRFFHLMLEEGVYLAPSAFEAGFMSLAHSEADIQATLEAADRAFAKLK